LWTAVASSADGSRLTAVDSTYYAYGTIWMSMDAGATWKQAGGAQVGNATAIAGSDDGTKQFVAVNLIGTSIPGRILANVPGPLVVHGSSLVDLTYIGGDTFFATNVEGSADAP
jgi:hypothetical protein